MTLVLNQEQREEDFLKRKEEFEKGLEELSERTQFQFTPKIGPDGPFNALVNTKKYAD